MQPEFLAGRPLVIVCGTAHWTALRLAEHHLARRLAERVEVLFVDPPVSPATQWRRPEVAAATTGPALTKVAAGIHRLVPSVIPGKDRPGIISVADVQVRRGIRKAIQLLGADVVATILALPGRRLFDPRIPGCRIYWAKDDHLAGAQLYRLRGAARVQRVEQQLARAADQFLVCSPSLAEHWRGKGMHPVVFPNGCDVAHFADIEHTLAPEDARFSGPVAGFVGTVTRRLDLRLLAAVADRGMHVLVVGGRRRADDWPELDAFMRRPQVHMVGRRSYDQLPGYLAAMDVALVPYREDQYNLNSFPLKLLEYLAAGLPVVSTRLPAAQWLATPHVQIASSPKEFAETALASTQITGSRAIADRRRVAAGHDWDARASQLMSLVGLGV